METTTRNTQYFPKPVGLGYRHIQYVLLFTGAVVVYGMRTVLMVAIVAMIDKDNSNKNYPVYPEWQSKKNVILSSFSWGHVWFQIIAGQIAKNYGPKYFMLLALTVASMCILLIPPIGNLWGYYGVIALRAIEGAAQGVLFPSVHNLLSKWAPIFERAKWGSFVYAGQVLGNCIVMPITGGICSSEGGWPVAFYFYGSCGLIWCTIWFLFGCNSPNEHTRISEQEKDWIISELAKENKEKIATPWLSIFTSVPFVAILITHAGQNWGFWTLLTEIPSFMNQILHYSIAKNSMLSALPYFVMWLMSFIFSPIADAIIVKGFVSLETSRKIFNSIGLFIPALSLISLSFISSNNKEIIITILVIAVGFNAGHYSGFNINHIDLSPTHAGTLMGISNSVSAIFTICAPLAVDLVKNITGHTETDKELWNVIFCISAGFYIVAGVVFIIFGSGKIQPWNYSQCKDVEKTNE